MCCDSGSQCWTSEENTAAEPAQQNGARSVESCKEACVERDTCTAMYWAWGNSLPGHQCYLIHGINGRVLFKYQSHGNTFYNYTCRLSCKNQLTHFWSET